MREYTAEVLFRPESAALRYLPEGPCTPGNGKLSWVAIQHGADSTLGSVNILDLASGRNTSFELPGRPGFAFPTAQEGVYIAGVERHLGLFETATAQWTPLSDELETHASGTIINDGVAFDGGLVFGAKDLQFQEKKAGLYLWRQSDGAIVMLRSDQICSNGKVMTGAGNQWSILDIDSPTQQVVRYSLNVEEASLSEPEVVLDLTGQPDFPDGMIETPDGKSLIIAFYNPNDIEAGVARQYSIRTGEVEAVWSTPASPRVTCPQLIEQDGGIRLVLTTADEGMTPEQQARHTNAGCLFIAETVFDSLPNSTTLDLS